MSSSVSSPSPARVSRPSPNLAKDRAQNGLLRFSGFAIWGFILVVVASVGLWIAFPVTVVGVVCGHVARRYITRGRRRGNGLAVATLWIGYVSMPFTLFISIAFFVSTATMSR